MCSADSKWLAPWLAQDFVELLESLYPNASYVAEYKNVARQLGIEPPSPSKSKSKSRGGGKPKAASMSPVRGLDDDDDEDEEEDTHASGLDHAPIDYRAAGKSIDGAPSSNVSAIDDTVSFVHKSHRKARVDPPAIELTAAPEDEPTTMDDLLLQTGELDDMTEAVQREFDFRVQRCEVGEEHGFAELSPDVENLIVIPYNRTAASVTAAMTSDADANKGYLHLTLGWLLNVDHHSRERVLIDCKHDMARRNHTSHFLYHLTRNDWHRAMAWIRQLPVDSKVVDRLGNAICNAQLGANLSQVLSDGVRLCVTAIGEMVADEAAKIGVFLNAQRPDMPHMATVFYRLARMCHLFPNTNSRALSLLLPSFDASAELHQFVARFCAEHELSSLFIAYVESYSLARSAKDIQHLKSAVGISAGETSNFHKRWFDLFLALQEPDNLFAAAKINAAICLKPVRSPLRLQSQHEPQPTQLTRDDSCLV